jgi:hypothetical protein
MTATKQSTPFLLFEYGGHKVYYRYLTLDDKDIPADARMQRFAERYIARWIKQNHGTPPRSHHPLPYPWNFTYLIDFDIDLYLEQKRAGLASPRPGSKAPARRPA